MKRFFCLCLTLVMLLSLVACGRTGNGGSRDFFPTEESITLEALLERTRPETMLSFRGGFRADYRDEDTHNDGQFANTSSLCFAYDGDNILANQMVDYDNGSYQHMFFSTDPNDASLYIDSDLGLQKTDMDDRQLQNIMEQSLFGVEYYECTVNECKRSGDSYFLDMSCVLADQLVQRVAMNIDAQTGMVSDAVIYRYSGEEQTGETKLTMTYSGDIKIDTSPRDKGVTAAVEPNADESIDTERTPALKSGSFTFATTDLDGNSVTYNDFADAKLIMVNYWEPWCAPCVEEMPDLEKLYQNYKDQGFVILGVFSTEDGDEDAAAIVTDTGVTYPILHIDNRLRTYQTEYVPTTIFVDEDGNVVSEEPYVGAHSYEDWETILKDYLDE